MRDGLLFSQFIPAKGVRAAAALFLGRLMRVATTVITGVGVIAIWASFASGLMAKTSVEDGQSASLIGDYLAGRFARAQQDPEAAAAFYERALDGNSDDAVLLENSFQMETAAGRFDEAIKFAKLLVVKQPDNRMAQTVLALADFKAGNYSAAEAHMKAASEGPIGELTATIARAWIRQAAGDSEGALAILEAPRQAEWAQFYLLYHRALLTDVNGRFNEARAAFEKVFKQDNRSLRTALAYAHSTANAGDTTLAKAVLKEHLDKQQGEGHPLARELQAQLNAGERVGLLVKNPEEGLAEVFYGLGEALTGEGGVSLGIVYLKLALFVSPRHPFALAALANTYETLKKYEAANATYDLIPPGTALQSSIEIRKAFNLNALDKVDEAKAVLADVAKRDPSDLRPLEAIGNIMRARKRYDEAAEAYTRAIKLIPNPQKQHWPYFYSRGTCYERLKDWPLAEADLQKALALAPEQPMVLNYLGYSWVDQGTNLKQGLGLIEKAVSLRPDDGYIVDSLGWALYRLNDYKGAVKYLERAVELRADDPTLNDHLGDALWRVGRETEARYQWDQALSLKPDPEDLDKIKEKLEKGLPKAASKAVVKPKQAVTEAPVIRRRAQVTPKPATVE